MDEMDTLQPLERTALRSNEPEIFNPAPPDRSWRTEFDRQFNRQTVERVLKEARGLIRAAQEISPWRDQLGADDRLNGAVYKLLQGTRRWDPTQVDLAKFLSGVIHSTISHEIKHEAKRQRRSLDEDDASDIDDLEQDASNALSLERNSKNEVPVQQWWTPLLTQLRAVARGDHRVLALVTAYEAGKLDRRDVIAFTKLSPKQHDAAYRRLHQLAQHIDEKLRAKVEQAIE